MSNRDTLRDFQSRLASRLQEARVSGVAASWLAVEASGLKLLFPLSHAGEIFPWSKLQVVPYVKPWFLGVANLRGGLSGVIDMGAFLQDRAAAQRSDVAYTQCRLVALNPLLEVNCALLVDRLLGLRSVDAFVSSDEAPQGSAAYLGHRYQDAEGAAWQEVNLQAMSKNPAFLSITQ